MPKENQSRPRMVVFTQGEGNVIVVTGSEVQEFPVTKLTPDQIKDTNGAGDAFVGGKHRIHHIPNFNISSNMI